MTRRPAPESVPARSSSAAEAATETHAHRSFERGGHVSEADRAGRGRARSRVAAGAALLGVALVIAGCTPQPAPTTASPSGTSTSSSGTPAPEPTLVPNGTAQQNLPFFDRVNRATLAANPEAKGRDFIDALVTAGFTKADMQVTADMTTIGLKANSIQFSIRMGETCLIGQNGVDSNGYNSKVTPVLATGTCLIGQTRAIDW